MFISFSKYVLPAAQTDELQRGGYPFVLPASAAVSIVSLLVSNVNNMG